MHHEESLKEAELRYRIVSRAYGLGALLASDANANVRLQNHGHIVSSISNCKSNVLLLIFGETNNICLLLGANATAYH